MWCPLLQYFDRYYAQSWSLGMQLVLAVVCGPMVLSAQARRLCVYVVLCVYVCCACVCVCVLCLCMYVCVCLCVLFYVCVSMCAVCALQGYSKGYSLSDWGANVGDGLACVFAAAPIHSLTDDCHCAVRAFRATCKMCPVLSVLGCLVSGGSVVHPCLRL